MFDGTPAVFDGITYVIPCGREKLDHAAPAGELYTGQGFKHALRCVQQLAAGDAEPTTGPDDEPVPGRTARILVLSALYGLVTLDQVLEPYDLMMGQPDSVTAETLTVQAQALGIDWDPATERSSEVYTFLTGVYDQRLNEALRAIDVYPFDVYEGCEGADGRRRVGHYRRVLSIVARSALRSVRAEDLPAGPAVGPRVWIGADVQGFTWGVPILVSYGRLRRIVETLPVAQAPWVLDSRGFRELADHGTWTITAEEYAADVRRYVAEVGQLEWVAPQDWPAAAAMLARTGLTEVEHQRRTCASVVQLRAMLGDLVDVIPVVTGTDAAGYLRHIDMYAEYGIDLRAERGVIGVGALVGRAPSEAADIVRMLYAAGLRRMHGFGVKTAVLDEVGPLLDSIDSADWSGAVRRAARRGGGDVNAAQRCPHGIVDYEQNCPVAAQQWAVGQAARAAAVLVQEALPLFS